MKALSQVLDPAWATLMKDLRERGLLESTLVVWMGEFGRTPKINPQGRPRPLPGGLERGAGRRRHQGRAGRSARQRPTAMEVTDRPVGVADFYATILHGARHQCHDEGEHLARRPADSRWSIAGGKPIAELVG